jgi:tRNA 2-selenouridine synthase
MPIPAGSSSAERQDGAKERSGLFHDISLEQLLELQKKQEVTLVDVRSPSEYANATIPGSRNIPLFDDAERAEIGTIYKQVGVREAKERGLAIVSAKLPAFVKVFQEIPGEIVVFCWRGGMRSKSTAAVLALMGIRAYRLVGGYRAYRRWVVKTLESLPFRPKTYVVHGHTGTGKTTILRRLKALGYPVLDLEAYAGHRGSVFGHVGMSAHNQKTFDALLMQDLLTLQDAPYVLMEAESNRIGKVVLPEAIVRWKEMGEPIRIEMPLDARVRQILDDYRPQTHKQAYLEAFGRIKSRIHIPIAAEIEALIREDRFAPAVELLLRHYYDPRYANKAGQYPDDRGVTLQVGSVEEAVREIRAYLAYQGGRAAGISG